MAEKEKDRVILHCDCNSFFASVETVLNPAYAGLPMAVCGSQEERHGIVLAKNELAKKYGIETAETVWSAKQKCPQLVIAPPHYDAYVEFSHRINQIYDRYTDLVEPFSIDESWLDVTGSLNLFGDGCAIAEQLRRAVKSELGITISIGVSFNKMFAKIGSDYKKPDAITVISRENFRQIVYPLPVRAMMYVGPRTAAALESCNIRTIGALAGASPAFLVGRFGKIGEALHAYANGLDNTPVLSRAERSAPKSVGNGMTFHHDLVSAEELRAGLGFLAEEVAARLRAAGRRATTVSVTIKDTLLQTLTRQMPLQTPTNLARELADCAMRLVRKAWNIGRPVRALTVTAMNLIATDEGGDQIGFFDEEKDRRREKTTRIEDTLDKIRARYGKGAISSGATISSDFGIAPVKKSDRAVKGPKKKEKI